MRSKSLGDARLRYLSLSLRLWLQERQLSSPADVRRRIRLAVLAAHEPVPVDQDGPAQRVGQHEGVEGGEVGRGGLGGIHQHVPLRHDLDDAWLGAIWRWKKEKDSLLV